MKLSNRSLVIATLIGTALQLLMVVLGHNNAAIRNLFAAGGMGISCVAGILYAVISTEVLIRHNVLGGLIAGGVCAFIGIFAAVLMHDVPATLLLLGTVSSAVTGAVGGWLGRLFSSGRV